MGKLSKVLNTVRGTSVKISHEKGDWVRQSTLPNGISLASQMRLFDNNLRFSVLIETGAFNDPEGKKGLSHFLEHTLSDFALERKLFERMRGGVSLTTGPNTIIIFGAVEKTPENQRTVLKHIAGMLTSPVDDALAERERRRIHNEINDAASMPLSILSNISSVIYKGCEPWERTLGNRISLDRITVDDLNGYKSDWFRGCNIRMGFTGVQSHDDFHDLCDQSFSRISKIGTTVQNIPVFRSVDYRTGDEKVPQLYFDFMFEIPPAISAKEKTMAIAAGGYISKRISTAILGEGLVYHIGADAIVYPIRSGRFYITGNVLPEDADHIAPSIVKELKKAISDTDDLSRYVSEAAFRRNQQRPLVPFVLWGAGDLSEEMSFGQKFFTLAQKNEVAVGITVEDIQEYLKKIIFEGNVSIITYGDSRKLHSLEQFQEMLKKSGAPPAGFTGHQNYTP